MTNEILTTGQSHFINKCEWIISYRLTANSMDTSYDHTSPS